MNTIAFANEDHDVTLVDFSPLMLAEAQRDAERLGPAGGMEFVVSPAEDRSGLDLAAQFDVALSHNVIQYVEDPACHINALREGLKPGGVVSILSVNACSEVYRAILQREEPAEALEQLGAKTHRAGMFDVEALRYTLDEIECLLADAGFETLATCGVRCFIDYIANNERKYEPEFYALLEKLELEVSDRFPFNATARFFQLIARRD